jgi:hypothetical protein
MTQFNQNKNILIRTLKDSVNPEFYSIKEVASIFAVNEITIRRAIKKGWIVAIKIGEGKRSPYRISKRSIENIHQNLILSKIKPDVIKQDDYKHNRHS